MRVKYTPEIDEFIRRHYPAAPSVAALARELGERFGVHPAPRALSGRAQVLGAKRKEAPPKRPWQPEHLALLKEWAEEGVLVAEQFRRLEAIAPGAYPWATLQRQRRRMGLQHPQTWKGKPIEILERMYGTWSTRAIANAIERETGWRPSSANLLWKAMSLGLSVADATGNLTLTDAAQELGISANGLRQSIKALGIRKRGRGQVRYVDERSMATLRVVFPSFDEPVVTTTEAAKILGIDRDKVRQLCREGRLDGRRYGLGGSWRIPRRELARFQSRPGWFRLDGRELPPRYLLDTYVVAALPLCAISRRDGTTLAPSPHSKRVHFRKGATVGAIKGRRAGLLLIETAHGLIHCAPDLLMPEAYEPPPQILWWRQTLPQSSPTPHLAKGA